MKINSNTLYKTAEILLGRIVPAFSGMVILLALFCLGMIMFGCHSERPKPEEIQLSALSAGTEEERSSRLDRIADLLRALDADLTYPSTRPRSTIDWILVPRNCGIADYRVQSSTLSDHHPVVAEISLPR